MALWMPSLTWAFGDELQPASAMRSKRGGHGMQDFKMLESFARNQALPMNLNETADAFVLTVDAPGVEPSEVHIEGLDSTGQITVSTTFSHERSSKSDQVHWAERASGFASRSLRLPQHADLSRVTAIMNKGVITINVPKTSVLKTQPQGREIKVTTAGSTQPIPMSPTAAGSDQQPIAMSPTASDSEGKMPAPK
jgi:HSP20 family protein